MKIINKEYPPNYQEILKVFPGVEKTRNVLFCFGDSIYNPDGQDIPAQLVAHEAVHSARQKTFGVEEWWNDYLLSPKFRLKEELTAHIEEYRYFSLNHPRNARRLYLKMCAERLSGPLYGRLIKFEEAKRLIKDRNREG